MINLADPVSLRMKLHEIEACWKSTHSGITASFAYGQRQPNRTGVFENVYRGREWSQNGEPLSGQGSSIKWTPRARAALVHIIIEHDVKHIVDSPCGDLTWMRTLFPIFEAMNVSYTGVDIVRSQIESHQRVFAKPGVRDFAVVDLVQRPPPAGDLFFSRQALQHLNAFDALNVMHHWSILAHGRAKPPLLLATTYEMKRERQQRIAENFKYKTPDKDMLFLDFGIPPFGMPPPITAFYEQDRPEFSEQLGLWKLPLSVEAHGRVCKGTTAERTDIHGKGKARAAGKPSRWLHARY